MKRRFRARDGWLTFEDGREIVDDAALSFTHSGLTVDEIRGILDVGVPAVDRCFAVLAVAPEQAERLLSGRLIDNMRRVARRLDKSLVEAVRELRVPMRELICCCASGRDKAGQISMLLKRDAKVNSQQKNKAA